MPVHSTGILTQFIKYLIIFPTMPAFNKPSKNLNPQHDTNTTQLEPRIQYQDPTTRFEQPRQKQWLFIISTSTSSTARSSRGASTSELGISSREHWQIRHIIVPSVRGNLQGSAGRIFILHTASHPLEPATRSVENASQ